MPKCCEWLLWDGPIPTNPGHEDGILHPQFALTMPLPGRGKGKGKGKGKGTGKASGPAPGGSEEGQWAFGRAPTPCVPAEDQPDWPNQVNRFLVPCRGNPDKHWVRKARGISLGMLFFLHGEHWTASGLYNFYLSCRVLAVKQTFTAGRMAQYTRQMKQQEAASGGLSYFASMSTHRS